MALTEIPSELSSTPSIVDNGNATAITIGSDESVALGGALAANGGAVFNEGGADVDFRVESDINANGLVLLGDTGHVGINGSPTAYALEVFDTDGNGIAYKDTTNSVTSFMGAYQSVAITGTLTNHSYALWTNNTERLRIDGATGNVGIGTGSTTPAKKLVVQGTNHIATLLNTSDTANEYAQLLLQAGSSTNFIWTQNQNSTNYGGAHSLNIYTQQNAPIAFFTGGNNERMRISGSTGNVSITDGNLVVASGHGIDFSATSGAAGASSELLDDYEIGDWYPTIEGDGATASGQSYPTRTAKYTKIGSFVFLTCDVGLSALGTTTGSNAIIKGLPFSVQTNHLGGGSVGYYNGITNNSGVLNFYVAASQAYLMTGGAGYVARSDLTNTSRIICTIIYQTA